MEVTFLKKNYTHSFYTDIFMLLLNTGIALPFILNSLDNFHFTFCHKLEFLNFLYGTPFVRRTKLRSISEIFWGLKSEVAKFYGLGSWSQSSILSIQHIHCISQTFKFTRVNIHYQSLHPNFDH